MLPITRGFQKRKLLAVLVLLCALVPRTASAEPNSITSDYYNVLTTYACYAHTLWHDASPGGYWGDGIDAKDQNGAVRGSVNTFYTYAMIVHGMDTRQISKQDIFTLRDSGLSREKLISYLRKNLVYLVTHHKSAPEPQMPQWGYNWQSSLWMGALGPGSLLVWKDMSPDLQNGLIRVAAAEADWVASHPPKDGPPGDTGAEENAWNTNAPALALALSSDATSATLWWSTLKSYAANVYSRPSDKIAASGAKSGPLQDVTTSNIRDDYSLMNHGFFHPDYVQVSAQHLGESWLILDLGDKLHSTSLAKEFAPYATFNVERVWYNILRTLVLPRGEFAFPAGNDWTYHCSTNQAYFAYIASVFGDATAAEAERRGLQHVMLRRELSPPGRLLGDSNLEWWWEPLVTKRICSALLLHEADLAKFIEQPARSSSTSGLDNMTTTVELSEARVWWHRNSQYFASISWGNPQLGFFVPNGDQAESHPYMTLPSKFEILPRITTATLQSVTSAPPNTDGAVIRSDGNAVAAIICLPGSVVWLSFEGFNPIYIENDSLTAPGRTVEADNNKKTVFKALSAAGKKTFKGQWLCVDGFLAMATDASGFTYDPACRWNKKSVATDKVSPAKESSVWQMAPGDADYAQGMAAAIKIDDSKTSTISVTVADLQSRNKYQINFNNNGLIIREAGHMPPIPMDMK